MSEPFRPDVLEDDETLVADQIRALCPIVRLDRVQAGDVLLVRGGLGAKPTAALGGGDYSHAAIWLPHENEGSGLGLELIESDPSGVGPTWPNMITIREAHGLVWAAVFPDATRLSLRRHPDISTVDPTALRLAAARFRADELYRSYSPFERLVRASVLPRWLMPVGGAAMKLIDRRELHHPGAFCSELVVKFYASLGLPLFDTDLDPVTVSPSRLAQSDCRLQIPRIQAVLWPDAITNDASGFRSPFLELANRSRHRAGFLKGIVAARETHARMSEEIASVNDSLRLRVDLQDEQQRAFSRKLISGIRDSLSRLGSIAPATARKALARLYVEALQIDQLLGLIEKEASSVASNDTIAQHCLLSLKLLCAKSLNRVAHDLTRYELLRAYGVVELRKDGARRRRLLKQVKSYREARSDSFAIVESASKPDDVVVESLSTEKGRNYVARIVTEALDRAEKVMTAEVRGVEASL